MAESPVVSVLLPVHNGEKYIDAALQSILDQSFRDLELLALDDGSTDGTLARLQAWQSRDPRLQVQAQPKRGLSATLNHGLQLARGRYIARMDADDISQPERLMAQVEWLERDPGCVIVGSACQIMDPSGQPGGLIYPPLSDTGIRWKLLFDAPFEHPTVMLRADTLRRYGLSYNPDMACEDYDLWSRLLLYGRGYNLQRPLLRYRVHAAQATQVREQAIWENANQIAQRNLARLLPEISLAVVDGLRQVSLRDPRPLTTDRIEACRRIFQILDLFEQQPGIEAKDVQVIRRYWIDRVLKAAFPGQMGQIWGLGLVERIWQADPGGLLSWPVRQAIRSLRWRLGLGRPGGFDRKR